MAGFLWEPPIAAPSSDPTAAVERSLRVGLFPSFFYRSEGGALGGVAIEIARSLAHETGEALALQEYPSPPAVVKALAAGACDVAFLGIDPARAAAVDFSPPLFAADFSFLVPPGSAVQNAGGADRPGTRIALVRGHAMDTALRSQIEAATPVYADTPDLAFTLLCEGRADLLAGIRPGLLAYARRLPGSRVLADRYGRNVIALAVQKGAADRLAVVGSFVARALADGLVRQALERTGVEGVDLADKAA